MRPGVPARRAAAVAVGRVARQGAFLNVVLDPVTAGLDPDDRRHARRLAYEAVRLQAWVDPAIERAAGRPLEAIDPTVLDILRVAGAELAADPATTAVAVHTAVEVARSEAPRATGFVNAVARRLAESPPGPPGPGAGDRHAVPDWLAASLAAAWGEDEAEGFLAASNTPAERGVRLRPGAPPDPRLHPVPGVPGAATVDPGPLPDGCVVQDPASVAVTLATGARAGDLVADLAAAPGGKTLHLLDLVGETGRVVSVERHERRARSGARRAPGASWVVADAARPPLPDGRFDRVLLDAPCSGLGVLRRRPEIRHRVGPEAVTRLAAGQRRMLEVACRLARPGGRVVYAVCTVTPEETVEAVAGLGFHPPDGIPGRPWGDGLLLGPHLGPYDGMFIAVREC